VDLTDRGRAMLPGVVQPAEGLGVCIAAASDDRQRRRAWRLLLNFFTGKSCPVATDLVELTAHGRAVARVSEEHSLELAGAVDCPEHRDAPADGPVRVDSEAGPAPVVQDAPICGDGEFALPPRQARRLASGQCLKRDLLERICQLAGVALDSA